LDNKLSKYTILTLSIIFIFSHSIAQNFSDSGINIGLKLGGSKLLGEIPNDFSGIINEFDNKLGYSSAFEISKYITPRWEIGSEYGYSLLKGNTYSPDFSAEGIQPGIPDEINDPVEYKNKLSGLNFFFRYYFKDAGSESAIIPFIRAGGGFLKYKSEFKYIDAPDDDLLFGKGNEGYPKLSTPAVFMGTGFKTPLSSHFYLLTAIDFHLVAYDFLDVVHNYVEDGTRLKIAGLYTEFKVGIFYTLNKSGGDKNNKNSSKNGGSSKGNNLPFGR